MPKANNKQANVLPRGQPKGATLLNPDVGDPRPFQLAQNPLQAKPEKSSKDKDGKTRKQGGISPGRPRRRRRRGKGALLSTRSRRRSSLLGG